MIPIQLMHICTRNWPNVFRAHDLVRSTMRDEYDWPAWCYAPGLAAKYAIGMSMGMADERVCLAIPAVNAAIVAAVAAWRPTQSVYRFDPDVEKALVSTDIRGVLPVDHLMRLPEWCVFCDALGGFFAHLEPSKTFGAELRVLVPGPDGILTTLCLPLTPGATLADAMLSWQHNPRGGDVSTPSLMSVAAALAPIVSLLLYLCADDPDMVATRCRGKITPKERVGRDGKPYMPAANKPEVWEVGFRLGATLRSDAGPSGAGGHVRPHVRRAHWHSFWTGQKPDQKLRLRWVAPVLVKGGPDRPTIRHVETT